MPRYNVQYYKDGHYEWVLGVEAKDRYGAEEIVTEDFEDDPKEFEILEVEEQ